MFGDLSFRCLKHKAVFEPITAKVWALPPTRVEQAEINAVVEAIEEMKRALTKQEPSVRVSHVPRLIGIALDEFGSKMSSAFPAILEWRRAVELAGVVLAKASSVLPALHPPDPTWWSLHCSTPGCPSWAYVKKTASPDYQNCSHCGQAWAVSWKEMAVIRQILTSASGVGPNKSGIQVGKAKVQPLESQQEYCTSHHMRAALYL